MLTKIADVPWNFHTGCLLPFIYLSLYRLWSDGKSKFSNTHDNIANATPAV